MSDIPSNSICILVLFMLRSILMSRTKNLMPYSYAVASTVVVHPLYFSKTRTDRPNGTAEDLEPGNATNPLSLRRVRSIEQPRIFPAQNILNVLGKGCSLTSRSESSRLLESYLRKEISTRAPPNRSHHFLSTCDDSTGLWNSHHEAPSHELSNR